MIIYTEHTCRSKSTTIPMCGKGTFCIRARRYDRTRNFTRSTSVCTMTVLKVRFESCSDNNSSSIQEILESAIVERLWRPVLLDGLKWIREVGIRRGGYRGQNVLISMLVEVCGSRKFLLLTDRRRRGQSRCPSASQALVVGDEVDACRN
jgi:hypothetical protein